MNPSSTESGKKPDIAKKFEDTARKSMDPALQGAHQVQETLSSFNTSVMKAFDQNRSAVQQLMRAMQEESMRFMSARFEHTSRALERTRDYQGVAGLITMQQDWLLDIARDYAEFNKRWGELLQEVAEHGMENGHGLMAETIHNAPKTAHGDRAAA